MVLTIEGWVIYWFGTWHLISDWSVTFDKCPPLAYPVKEPYEIPGNDLITDAETIFTTERTSEFIAALIIGLIVVAFIGGNITARR